MYRRYGDRIYNTALSYAQNVEDAEEITQDVFTKMYRAAGGFRGDAAVTTWIYRITVNTALNHLKRRRRRDFLRSVGRPPETPDFDHPGVLLENREAARELFALIRSLPERQRTAVVLSYVEDLPRREVADVMQISLKAVESLLVRARRHLRTRLDKDGHGRRKID